MKLGAHTPEAYCNTSLHLIDKNWSCARPPRGGRPERVATLGVLSTINPNLSSTKEKTGNSFEGRYDLPSLVRSHRGKKSGSGNRPSLSHWPPKNGTEFWTVRIFFGIKKTPRKKRILVYRCSHWIALALSFNLGQKSTLWSEN